MKAFVRRHRREVATAWLTLVGLTEIVVVVLR